MTDSKSSNTCSETRDLIMPYLEDLLTAEERSELEEHMRNCTECTDEMREMKRWASMLEANREVMCPEAWELFEYAHDPSTDRSILEIHLRHCTSCKEQYEAFLQRSTEESVPERLWERIVKSSETPMIIPKQHLNLSQRIESLFNWIQDFFSVQFLAFATVAAAILLVVIFYPSGSPQTVGLLSSENWSSIVIKRNLMSPRIPQQDKKRMAELVIFKGKGEHPQQKWIDGLYRALEPSEKSAEIFHWITPAEISKAFTGKQLNVIDRKAIVQQLHSKLDVTNVILITITSGKTGRTYDVNIELVSAKTGDVLKGEKLTGLREKDLGNKTKGVIRSILKVN